MYCGRVWKYKETERSARVGGSENIRKRNVVPGRVCLEIQGNGTWCQGGWVWKYKETERSARVGESGNTRKRNVVPGWVGLEIQGNGT